MHLRVTQDMKTHTILTVITYLPSFVILLGEQDALFTEKSREPRTTAPYSVAGIVKSTGLRSRRLGLNLEKFLANFVAFPRVFPCYILSWS